MTTLQDAFDNLVADQREAKRKFHDQALELFKGITKEFFEKNPGITAVKWTQYTPYFNDGSPCVFNVNTPYVTNCPVDELHDLGLWGEYEGEREDVFSIDDIDWTLRSDNSYWKKDKELLTNLINDNKIEVESIKKFVDMITHQEMEFILLTMFDDHSVVTATRDGFDAEECAHD